MPRSPHKTRPAETVAGAGGIGGVIAGVAAHNWLAVATATVGLLPALVTLLVANGGIRGAARALWRGRDVSNP